VLLTGLLIQAGLLSLCLADALPATVASGRDASAASNGAAISSARAVTAASLAAGAVGSTVTIAAASCLAHCCDCLYGEYWFHLSRYVYDDNRSFASYTNTKSVESAV
jgi:hypothetical protein